MDSDRLSLNPRVTYGLLNATGMHEVKLSGKSPVVMAFKLQKSAFVSTNAYIPLLTFASTGMNYLAGWICEIMVTTSAEII